MLSYIRLATKLIPDLNSKKLRQIVRLQDESQNQVRVKSKLLKK